MDRRYVCATYFQGEIINIQKPFLQREKVGKCTINLYVLQGSEDNIYRIKLFSS